MNEYNPNDEHQGGGGDEDADSNIQVGERSQMGGQSDAGDIPLHEPGPNDPPGVKYASYDSGPSFGNFGPMPTDDRASMNPPYTNSWNPDWNHIQNKHPSDVPWNQGTENGGNATPTAPHNSEEFGRVGSPRSSQPLSKAGSVMRSHVTGNGQDRPFSPPRSKAPSASGFPPLPESAYGDFEVPLSPRSRAYSKAPSISPSDSPSQMPKPKPVKTGSQLNGTRSPPPSSPSPLSASGHQTRHFAPYRQLPTQEDLLHAAVRGRALAIPEESERQSSVNNNNNDKTPSQAPQPELPSSPQRSQLSVAQSPKMPSQLASPRNKLPSHLGSQLTGSKVGSQLSAKQSTLASSKQSQLDHRAMSRGAQSPDTLDPEQRRMVHSALLAQNQTPRTSYYEQSVNQELTGHFHDDELCQLLRHESDGSQPEVIRKALRKAIRQRVKRLGIKYDTEAIKQYKRSYRDHDHEADLTGIAGPNDLDEEPPRWASDIKRELVLMQQRIESLGPKIENLRQDVSYDQGGGSRFQYEDQTEDFTRTPQTRTVNIDTHPTGTMADSMYHGQDDIGDDDEDDGEHGGEHYDDMTEAHNPHRRLLDGDTTEMGRDDSPGQQFLEEELYKLQQRPRKAGSQGGQSHRTWEIAREDGTYFEDEEEEEGMGAPSGLQTIPDTNADDEFTRNGSPPLPALPDHEEEEDGEHEHEHEHEHGEDHSRQLEVRPPGAGGQWNEQSWVTSPGGAEGALMPWQKIHARLLQWAIVWPTSELEQALNSTTRGHQVDEVALTIWSTQTYKRYVRARLTEKQGGVDRLFVPPNMADAISNAVFNGRHGEACGMLKDLWTPFGFGEMPRLIVVLAKHRSDPNHWVVHKFSLQEGTISTYDSCPDRALPDGRPLGWWFAFRIAWPNAQYPKPDQIRQKMVRLHRPMQLPIDNSVSAAGIWRNILMGSRAERSLDLERLRDLINTEVKNLKQRKMMGKLSVTPVATGRAAAWD